MRSERSLRALCRRELAGLHLDLPLSAEQLCERYGTRRGRPIRILDHPLPADAPSGIWLAAEDGDYFFCQANTTPLHREQIIVHEFSHLMAGHQLVDPGSSAPTFPTDAESDAALGRTCYSDEREWEAEVLATQIVDWAATATRGVGHAVQHRGLRGVQRALGGHRGWL
ncbi:hypothetical protein [Williamsia sterculiae]|uniref:IrrE N-terminal-like domain-containing protein n=1 Tax=Williamsia sterculiae TaxID=1344003 RepID=A0A1N7H9A5_9NOCA|nr:hypothetical protein [Williamsia sterculiae]SIS21439.1 hypothetical protein SAMN05445060_3751 [Williamsia sterculiae]